MTPASPICNLLCLPFLLVSAAIAVIGRPAVNAAGTTAPRADMSSAEVPSKIPRRRATQLLDGFGVNLDLPRRPRMPWTKTWTPLFDSGAKWVRIGQYENSSEKISWDWVEQTPGHYAVPEDADEAVRSLLDNGVSIEAELQDSNPLYAQDRSKRPERVTLPPPGIGPGDNPVNPIFLAPRTDEQIEAFLGYVRFMVGRYQGRIKHWELWNEENIGYWRPEIEKTQRAKWYGRVLSRFADAVHATAPEAKVMFGGLAGPDLEFAANALAGCAAKLDIMAYHSYPGLGIHARHGWQRRQLVGHSGRRYPRAGCLPAA